MAMGKRRPEAQEDIWIDTRVAAQDIVNGPGRVKRVRMTQVKTMMMQSNDMPSASEPSDVQPCNEGPPY